MPLGAPVRVLLVEDHAATREALTAQLDDFRDRISVVATFADAESLLALDEVDEVDVALVDLNLPKMGGVELISTLRGRSARPVAIALTIFEDERTVLKTIGAGAFGYLLKDEAPARIVACIEEAAAGAHPISSRVAGFLFSQARRSVPPVLLSDREAELARHLSEGLSYAECAERMGVAIGTLQNYVKRLYRKLDVNTRQEVLAWVARYVHR